MKNIFNLLFFIIPLFSFSQNLPSLNLKENTHQKLNIPININDNDICVIFEKTHGWSAYNYRYYYIFNNKKEIICFKEQKPKNYLKKNIKLKASLTKLFLSSQQKNKLHNALFSETTKNFLNFSQENFQLKKLNRPLKCSITDATGYNITFIQNNKSEFYKYYAPKFYYKKCNDKNINKTVLGKYLELIDLWNLEN